jgi:twinkle protein
MSETAYVSLVYSKIARWSKKFNCFVFMIAHTTKMQKDKATGKYEVPTLYHISGSANFFNKTHYGASVYRDYSSGIVTVYWQKIKQSWMGQVGWSSFSFDTMTRQYNYIESSHAPVASETKEVPVFYENYYEPISSQEDDEAPF